MKPSTPMLALASLVLMASPLHAMAQKDKSADPPGFNELDKDKDGQLSRAEAAGNPNLARRFDEADGDKDGRVSRAEYLRLMTAQDFRSLRQQLADFIQPGKDDHEPPGFNELDKDKDGRISRAEAAANPVLAQRFAESDDDGDGYVSRAEYLKTMAAVDWDNARRGLADLVRPEDKGSSRGASSPKK